MTSLCLHNNKNQGPCLKPLCNSINNIEKKPLHKLRGILLKKSSKFLDTWKEKWVVLENKKFMYFNKKSDNYSEGTLNFDYLKVSIS